MTTLNILISDAWRDYELLDSGDGQKLERFGEYTFVRPEPQAMWKPRLAQQRWSKADAVFHSADADEDANSKWEFHRAIPSRWQMRYRDVPFWVETTPFRHMGVFPEHAAQWDWMSDQIRHAGRRVSILNLFGYTGVSTLLLAAAGASVTHVDASKKVVAWARENQALARLEDRPVRWIVEDALKYTRREAKRGTKYDGIIIDPPKFGRGPQGEVWKLHESLPLLLEACREVLSDQPLFVLLSTYAVRVSGLSLSYLLQEMMQGRQGYFEAGEMGTAEANGRALVIACYARWRS